MRWARLRLGLRLRATVAFALSGLLVALLLAMSTLLLTSRYLVAEREDAALRQAFANARLARNALRAANVDAPALLAGLGGDTDSSPVLRVAGEFFGGSLGVGRDLVPDDVLGLVNEGHAALQRVEGPDGQPTLVVGMALPAVDAAYFEVFPLTELQETLSTLRATLMLGVAATVAISAVLGRYAGSRVVQPLEPVAAAAQRIAGGELGTRLPAGRDRDLDPLTEAFNAMAAALEERVAQEARFASDVSHELRTPLAVLAASIDVINRRRAELPPTVVTVLDLLADRIDEFETLVLELLEISRFDNHAADLDLEPVEVRGFLGQLVTSRTKGAELVVDEGVPQHLLADRRRLAQALSSIIDNAARYAGGTTRCHAHATSSTVTIDLDDHGPGVDPSERRVIFDRFARGSAGQRAGAGSGTGLGLALAAEHVKLHDGHIDVADAPGGGARFRLTLPRIEP